MHKAVYLAGLLMASGASAQTITDAPSFIAAIKAAKAADNSTDQFAEKPANTLAGKLFKLTLPLSDRGEAAYHYADGVLTLDLSPTLRAPTSEIRRTVPTLKVSSSRQSLGSYVGQNAFGATAKVTSSETDNAAIGIVDSPKAMQPVDLTGSGIGRFGRATDWWTQLTLPPAEAKATAFDTVAVVEGIYADLPYKKFSAGACSIDGRTATVSSPYETFVDTCFVGAKVTRVAFVRKSTGAVVKEWTLENSPRLGPVLWGNIRIGMTADEVKALYPDFDLGSADGFRVESDDSGAVKRVIVKAVNVAESGREAAKPLTAKYGTPLQLECSYSICKGKWKVDDQVVVYMTILGNMDYRLATDEAPSGF